MMAPSRTSIPSILLTLGLAPTLCAQTAPSTPSLPGASTGPRLVEQGFEDIGPLGQSLILQPIDTRLDQDFARIYDIGDGSGRYVRRNGAISAVFAQSEYVTQRGRTRSVVPAGTIYYIGDPLAIEEQQSVQQAQSLGTARRLLGTPLSAASRPGIATDQTGSSPTPLRPAHADTEWRDIDQQTAESEQRLRDRGVLAPAPSQRRVDVLTHEPYRRGRLHEMTRRMVVELLEQAPERPTPDATLEDLDAALER